MYAVPRPRERDKGKGKKMDNITASEIAGLGFGTLLLCATFATPKVDSFIASSQRSSLDLCKRCGNLRMIACSNCKGVGSVKEGGLLNFSFIDDVYQSLGGAVDPNVQYVPCTKCRAKGRFSCPDCSKTP